LSHANSLTFHTSYKRKAYKRNTKYDRGAVDAISPAYLRRKELGISDENDTWVEQIPIEGGITLMIRSF
jgi:hypothetical protein